MWAFQTAENGLSQERHRYELHGNSRRIRRHFRSSGVSLLDRPSCGSPCEPFDPFTGIAWHMGPNLGSCALSSWNLVICLGEGRYLQDRFGEEYSRYKSKVRRWI